MQTIAVQSKSKHELINIAEQVRSAVSQAKTSSGIVLIFVPHTTAGLICNEDETNLKGDVLKVAASIEQHKQFFGGFSHDYQEGNAAAHVISALSGNSRSFIIKDGQLALGTWQSIMFLELDGPRNRQIWIQIISDS